MLIGKITSAIILLSLLVAQSVMAEETIKVLMMENPYEPLPSDQAEKVYTLNGKVFIDGRFYEGFLEIFEDPKGHYLISKLPFERYIEGVVAAEMGNEGELEALKAQAVIARTYAMFYKSKNAGKNFHLSSSSLHQVYNGVNTDPLISYAVMITKGEILTYDKYPANTVYHNTCEGKTELPEEVWDESYPYLKSVDCYSRNAPYEKWMRRFSLDNLERSLGIEEINHVSIESYTATGRVRNLDLIFTDSENQEKRKNISASDLRQLLGYDKLPSTHFSLTHNGEILIFKGKGYGHGVGLSQWGALAMAQEGKNYREILSHYYPGTILQGDDALKYQAFKTAK